MKKYTAFTLIEVILYIAIVSIITLAVGSLIQRVIYGQARNQTASQTDLHGASVVGRLEHLFNVADTINVPASGTTASSLTWDDSGVNYQLTLVGNQLILTVNTTDYPLTSSNYQASNLLISNKSAGTSSVTVEFDLVPNNPGNQAYLDHIFTGQINHVIR